MNYTELDEPFDRLWAICRSITGPGITELFLIMQDHIPISTKEILTGTEALDWIVSKEWALDRAT
jgi:aminopeptidase-like protein